MRCGILHKDNDSGAVEPILPGSFAGRGKLACWKAFLEAEEDAVYCTYGSGDNCTACRAVAVIEKLVCQL